jgi:hypothetical protein
MDRLQGHFFNKFFIDGVENSNAINVQAGAGAVGLSLGTDNRFSARQIATDTTNGTPRTGKTTDPRTAGQYAYTWGGQYIP